MNKSSVTDLGILGGAPLFDETLHVGKPNLGDRQVLLERINEMLDRNWLTNFGPLEKAFEARLAEHLGVEHCVAFCNATIALEMSVRALGMTGEVIVPSFTFVATAHCLQWQEIVPVFCDVDERTRTIDPDRIANLITPKTSGVIGVHLWGQSCRTGELAEVCERFGLKLLFDASHAFGVSHNGTMVGHFGEAEVFSFHATKFLNAFEGGAVATNNAELAEKLRLMKNFGFSGMDNVIYLGSNGKMTEVSAAMGLTSLDSMEHFIEVNRSNHAEYARGLDGVPGIELNRFPQGERNNFQYVVIDVDAQAFGMSRNRLMSILHAENVRARRYFFPGVHRMEPYLSYYPNAGLVLPVTNALVERTLCLPTGTAMDAASIRQVCGLIEFIGRHADTIESRMESEHGA